MTNLKTYLQHHPTKFLLVRTDRLGDVILASPVARILRRSFSPMTIQFLVKKYTFPLVSNHPYIDRAWVEEDFPTFREKIRFLRRNRFDGVIFLHPEPDWALACFRAGIPIRIGSGYRVYSILLTHRVFVHRKFGDRHEADLNIDLLQPLGIRNAGVQFDFRVAKKATEAVSDLLKESRIGPPFVVLHPGSAGSALDWPVPKFARLADLIKDRLRLPVVFTGGRDEAELVDQAVALSNHSHIRLDGRLDLLQLAALLQSATLMVANSTGPLHLAVALGTEVIGLYCPEQACHPNRWGPYGKPDSVILPPVNRCARCRKVKCEHFNCMELITVDQVFTRVTQKLVMVKDKTGWENWRSGNLLPQSGGENGKDQR